MVLPIEHDPVFLAGVSDPAGRQDEGTAGDLMDTLMAHRGSCVGMAANMISRRKRIIVFLNGPFPMLMYNPVITKKEGPYEAEEGCLSLTGTRKTTRYERIEVSYEDRQWKRRKGTFDGWTAQIIQHECDHLEGILI